MKVVYRDLSAYGYKASPSGLMQALLFSPGFAVTLTHRIAFFLYPRNVLTRVIAKILWRLNIIASGCYISPTSKIGAGLYLPHPTGIVLGDGVVIGENATIYQGVTMGVAKRGRSSDYPQVGNDVVIFASAILIGGVKIGDGARVGAQSLVLSDVQPGSTVVGSPARLVKRHPRQ